MVFYLKEWKRIYNLDAKEVNSIIEFYSILSKFLTSRPIFIYML